MSDMKICCLCVEPKLSLLDINTPNADGTLIVQLIGLYLSIKVEKAEMYPAVICYDCKNQILSFHLFATRVHHAQCQLEKNPTEVQDDNTVFEVTLKEESIKQEKPDAINFSDAETDDHVTFDSHLPEPLLDSSPKKRGRPRKTDCSSKSSKLSKKRGRPRKIKSEDDCYYYSGTDKAVKLEAIDIKIEDEMDSKHSKRSSKRRSKKRKFLDEITQAQLSATKDSLLYYLNHTIDMADTLIMNFTCYICNENFDSGADLRKHQSMHLSNDPSHRWPCIHCDRKFKHRNAAIKHIKNIHDGSADFVCHECGRAFKTAHNLDDHLVTHTNVANFECDKCGKKFKLKQALKGHLDTHRDTAYECPKCGLLLNSRRTLRNHMYTHDEVGRQVCPICGKRFKQRKAIKSHLNIHTGERPFKCLWCPKTFANNSNCRIHKKRVHKFELMVWEAQRGISYDKTSHLSHLDIESQASVQEVASLTPCLDVATQASALDMATHASVLERTFHISEEQMES